MARGDGAAKKDAAWVVLPPLQAQAMAMVPCWICFPLHTLTSACLSCAANTDFPFLFASHHAPKLL